MTALEKRRAQLCQEAADLIVRAHSKGVAPHHDAAISTWRQSSTANEAAYRETMSAWDAAEGLGAYPLYADLMGTPTWLERWVTWRGGLAAHLQRVLRPQFLALASLLAVVAMIGVWRFIDGGAPTYRTSIAEVREIGLEDGSSVTLGAKSVLDVDFTRSVRRVKLAEGEAFFSVAHNPSRPFLVRAGSALIRVVGTKFNVNVEHGRVRVTVLEGVVQVAKVSGEATGTFAPDQKLNAVTITAGQQAFDATFLDAPEVEIVPTTHAGSWREGRFSYQDAPLAEIIADANRYRTGPIRLDSSALGRERLTTSFKTSQVDQMLEQLPDALPLHVRQNPDGSVDLQSR